MPDFGFPGNVETIDAVPDAYRSVHTSSDDASATLIEPIVERIAAMERMRTELGADRKALRTAVAELSKWTALGTNPDELAAVVSGYKALGSPDFLCKQLERTTPLEVFELEDRHRRAAFGAGCRAPRPRARASL